MVEELAALRCVCGRGVRVKLEDMGERVCNVVFFDDEPTGDTYGERVRECPGCAVGLGLHTLIPGNTSMG